MTAPSRDYHDYVFKDGRFVGDFEGMYRHSKEIPWHQDKMAYDLCADVDIAILRKKRFGQICDVGAGLGHFTNRLKTELAAPDGKTPEVVGLEVSPTAVACASREYPEVRFVASDILANDWAPDMGTFDLVIARDIIWYVCHDLQAFFTRLVSLAGRDTDRGFIHISQSFPSTERWVGQEIAGSPEELLRHLGTIVEVSHSCVEHDTSWNGGCVLHALGRVRALTDDV